MHAFALHYQWDWANSAASGALPTHWDHSEPATGPRRFGPRMTIRGLGWLGSPAVRLTEERVA